MTWTAEELYWWTALYLKAAQWPGVCHDIRGKNLAMAAGFLMDFKKHSDQHPNLQVQYDQLKRQLEAAKG